MSQESMAAATSPQFLEENYSTLQADTELAEQEWQEISNAFAILEDYLDEDFHPLSPELFAPAATPFGPVLKYQALGIAGIWLNYYMGLIVTHRAHPSMPPAALIAAGISARKTSHFANDIGRIAAGIDPYLLQHTEIDPGLAAALVESCLALFVAGIQVRVSKHFPLLNLTMTLIHEQYQDASRRQWVVQRFSDIARLTGYKTATTFSQGCEAAWIKNAEMGKGPPYRRADDNSSFEGSGLKLPRVIDTIPASNASKLVVQRAERVHYALGLLSVEEDFEKLDLGQAG